MSDSPRKVPTCLDPFLDSKDPPPSCLWDQSRLPGRETSTLFTFAKGYPFFRSQELQSICVPVRSTGRPILFRIRRRPFRFFSKMGGRGKPRGSPSLRWRVSEVRRTSRRWQFDRHCRKPVLRFWTYEEHSESCKQFAECPYLVNSQACAFLLISPRLTAKSYVSYFLPSAPFPSLAQPTPSLQLIWTNPLDLPKMSR